MENLLHTQVILRSTIVLGNTCSISLKLSCFLRHHIFG